jgi:DNA modification methylase
MSSELQVIPKCGRRPHALAYQTSLGRMFHGKAEEVLTESHAARLRGNVQLIFTSPPFPLNRKKKYGNHTGGEYIEWLASFGRFFSELLTPDGSVVLELGNAWEPGSPVMSTLALEALLGFKRAGGYYLCQEFIWHNPARLPSPAQWVNVERIRVKDSFTRLWWMSRVERPKADNRKVLQEYSDAMKGLLRSKRYNAGKRPSEHHIGEESFLTDNGGAISPNVLVMSNTTNNDPYQAYCRERGITLHPARMPIGLAEYFINFLTDAGDIVLDPFAGSNTTGAAAERLNRQWVAVEADRNYIEGSKGRFEQTEVVV